MDGACDDLGGVLDALTRAWRVALGDRRCSVVLSGRGGADTTRVAAELALQLHAEGALVLHGRWDQDVEAPYQGIREALGVYADGHDLEQVRADLEGWGEEIARLLPDVAARVGAPGGGAPPRTAAGDERARLFDAVEAWIGALARRRATLLVLDDVHRAEPSSLLLVDHLHQAGAGLPLLIVVTVGADDAGGGGSGAPTVLAHADPGEVERIDLDR